VTARAHLHPTRSTERVERSVRPSFESVYCPTFTPGMPCENSTRSGPGLPGMFCCLEYFPVGRMTRPNVPSSIIALADHYQPGTSFLSLLDPDNRGWSLAERLTFHDTVNDTIVFHHDDFAEGLVEAGLHGAFEPWVSFGEPWLKKALAKLVQVGSAHSRSLAIDGLSRLYPDLLSGDELLAATTRRGKDDGRALSAAAS